MKISFSTVLHRTVALLALSAATLMLARQHRRGDVAVRRPRPRQPRRGLWNEAIAVNDTGQAVGSGLTGARSVHPFSWTEAGGMVDLGTLGGTRGSGRPP